MNSKILPVLGSFLVSTMIFSSIMTVNAASLHGSDIYHGTWIVDFNSLKSSGYGDFVFIKATEGSSGNYDDSRFVTNYNGAKAAGIPFAPYHFLNMGSYSYGVQQADHFWSKIKGTGYSIYPAVDVEDTDGYDAPAIQQTLRGFIDEFYSLSGYKPIIYSYYSFINEFIGSGFTDCKLWISRFTYDYNKSPGSVAGWGTNYSIYQYSDKGNISGVFNNADLDYTTDNSIFINGEPSQSSQANNSVVCSSSYSGFYHVSSLPQQPNSTAKTDFNVLDSNGNVIPNRQVSSGDRIIILGVSNGLAEIEYPSYSDNCWYHAYIHNLENYLSNDGYKKWNNGSTNESVYNNSGTKIGTIYPNESATILARLSNGMTRVLYNTSSGSETKSGNVYYYGK